MRISAIGPSTVAAAAVCALGLTGLASAVPGAARPEPRAERAAEAPAGAACGPAAWPYASACAAAGPIRTVRVIALGTVRR